MAISLVNRAEKYDLDKIAKEFKIEFEERTIPSDADVEAVVAERTTALLEARLRQRVLALRLWIAAREWAAFEVGRRAASSGLIPARQRINSLRAKRSCPMRCGGTTANSACCTPSPRP